jgi:hypothetical protein
MFHAEVTVAIVAFLPQAAIRNPTDGDFGVA